MSIAGNGVRLKGTEQSHEKQGQLRSVAKIPNTSERYKAPYRMMADGQPYPSDPEIFWFVRCNKHDRRECHNTMPERFDESDRPHDKHGKNDSHDARTSNKRHKTHTNRIQKTTSDFSDMHRNRRGISLALTALMRAFQNDISKFGSEYSENVDRFFHMYEHISPACGLTKNAWGWNLCSAGTPNPFQRSWSPLSKLWILRSFAPPTL